MAFVEAIVVLALLYFIGRSVYGKRTNRKFSLLSVLVNFFIIMVTNAVIMLLVLAVLALLIGGVGLMFGDSDEFFFVGVNERVATGQLLAAHPDCYPSDGDTAIPPSQEAAIEGSDAASHER